MKQVTHINIPYVTKNMEKDCLHNASYFSHIPIE